MVKGRLNRGNIYKRIAGTGVMTGSVSLLILLFLLLSPDRSYADSSGKNELVAGQSINGILVGSAFMYGIGTRGWHDWAVVPGGIGGGLVSFSSTVELVDEDEMPHKRASLINSISFWSMLEGYLFAWVAGGELKDRVLFSSMANTLLTGYAFYMSNRYETSSDDIALINFTGIWGTLMLIELAKFIKPKSTGMAKYVVTTFVTASLIAGYYAADKYEMDAGRAGSISLYGLLGAFTGAGFSWVMYFKSERLYYLSMLMGTAAGLYLGYYLTDRESPENNKPFGKKPDYSRSGPCYRVTIGRYSW